ncbi:MAG: hypothetical protein ABSE42_15540, partial [Bryobacteraceae bacterium]
MPHPLRIPILIVGGAIAICGGWLAALPVATPGAIRFAYQPIPFTLDSCETPERHAPETMA